MSPQKFVDSNILIYNNMLHVTNFVNKMIEKEKRNSSSHEIV